MTCVFPTKEVTKGQTISCLGMNMMIKTITNEVRESREIFIAYLLPSVYEDGKERNYGLQMRVLIE